ncbi:hypothetical protein [Nonomuraea sp. NPDC049607]|uniref:hypothetical protein n=1 Tax=unclassified Nonomuraea TaxID=2593643 RepID=UPI00344014AF
MRHRSPVAGHLAAGWAAAYAGLRAYWSMGGEWLAARCTPIEAATAADQCAGRPLPQLDGLAGWGSVLALAGLAVLALATVRPFGRRLPRTALLAAIWAGTLALLCFGGQILLLNLLRVLLWVTGLPGWAAEPYWTLVVDQLIVLAGVGALAVAAWSFQRRTRPELTDARATGRWLRAYGWTAALAPLPYATLKAVWALGHPVGGYQESGLAGAHHWYSPLTDFSVTIPVCGALCAVALIQGWARWVPRPLVLAAGWTGGVGLLSMGLPAAVTTLGALAGLTELPSAPGSANPWVFGVTYGGFLVWGAALVGLITCYQALSRRPAQLRAVRPAARKESMR